jgi:hypothetical protein
MPTFNFALNSIDVLNSCYLYHDNGSTNNTIDLQSKLETNVIRLHIILCNISIMCIACFCKWGLSTNHIEEFFTYKINLTNYNTNINKEQQKKIK